MNKTFDIAKAVEAQKEYCKEYAVRHPEDWASKMMSRGEGFAPKDGRCWSCQQNVYSEQGNEMWGGSPTGRKKEGISVEQARAELTTGCPFCYRSYVD